jgi:hypothetical protein
MSAICWFLYRQRAQYTKTIHDYPTPGESRSHQAEWRSANFDRLLSKYVHAARSANAIDERRKDFDRVAWGQKESTNLRQRWFAGNHSDIGGSYPEAESRLSDISLQWMLEKILELENPINFGPVLVNGKQLDQTSTQGTPLFLYPDVTAMRHSEIAGTRDTIDALVERTYPFLETTFHAPVPYDQAGNSGPPLERPAVSRRKRSRRRCQTSHTLGSKKSGATKKCG